MDPSQTNRLDTVEVRLQEIRQNMLGLESRLHDLESSQLKCHSTQDAKLEELCSAMALLTAEVKSFAGVKGNQDYVSNESLIGQPEISPTQIGTGHLNDRQFRSGIGQFSHQNEKVLNQEEAQEEDRTRKQYNKSGRQNAGLKKNGKSRLRQKI